MERDFKYRQLVTVKEGDEPELKMSVRNKFLIPVAAAFKTNLERTETFALMPSQIAFRVRRDQLWVDCAELDALGKLNPDYYKFLGKFPDGINEAIVRIQLEFDTIHPDKTEQFKVGSALGIGYIEELLKIAKGMRHSMDAVLSSLVVSYWTVFESLVPDLWKASVNHGSAKLRQRVNLSTQDKPDPKISEHWKNDLQCDPIEDYAGSLIEAGRVSFRKLVDIVRWYSVVFEGEAKLIFKENSDVYALSAYRNVLVHNSGKADKDFIKQVEAVPDLRGRFKENEELNLDGELVSRLRHAVASIGKQLIELADDHLSPVQSS